MQHPSHRFLFPLKSIGFLPFGARSITVTLISSSDMRIARSGADAQLETRERDNGADWSFLEARQMGDDRA